MKKDIKKKYKVLNVNLIKEIDTVNSEIPFHIDWRDLSKHLFVYGTIREQVRN
jgi:hypothetical protein